MKAKERAGVEVVGLCGPNGELSSCYGGYIT